MKKKNGLFYINLLTAFRTRGKDRYLVEMLLEDLSKTEKNI